MNQRRVLVIFGLGLLLVMASTMVFLQAREAKGPKPEAETVLYFGVPGIELLAPETRKPAAASVQDVVNWLIAGPQSPGLVAVIPKQASLLSWSVDGGIAIVDFSSELQTMHPGGSSAELQTVFSIVNSLTRLPGISAVKLKIDGADVETLSGHVDLTEPLSFADELVVETSVGQ